MDKALIVVITNNGKHYLEKLLPSLYGVKSDVIVVDTGSTDEESIKYLKEESIFKVVFLDGGYGNAAINWAYQMHPEYNGYMFIHDSMEIKDKDFVEWFSSHGDVVGWLGFDLFFDNQEQIEWLNNFYGDKVVIHPQRGIFGPIFYCTRESLTKLGELDLFLPNCNNKNQYCASERGWAISFHSAGYNIQFIDSWNNDRINRDDYNLLTKRFAHRL